MVDTIDVRDTITNPVDNTDLLILCCQLKICDIGTQDGNDALSSLTVASFLPAND